MAIGNLNENSNDIDVNANHTHSNNNNNNVNDDNDSFELRELILTSLLKQFDQNKLTLRYLKGYRFEKIVSTAHWQNSALKSV